MNIPLLFVQLALLAVIVIVSLLAWSFSRTLQSLGETLLRMNKTMDSIISELRKRPRL